MNILTPDVARCDATAAWRGVVPMAATDRVCHDVGVDADATLTANPVGARIGLRAGAATACGHRRDHNEDAHAVGERICVVADGIGGHAAGEVAASIAVATLQQRLVCTDVSAVEAVAAITAAVSAANTAIRDEAAHAGHGDMGSTLVGAVVIGGRDGDAVAVLHVGDSRCYRLRDGVLDLVTRDHSLVCELVDAGRLDAADAGSHPMANVVTRALGVEPDVHADVALLGAEPGRLLLCTDGLSDELSARAIGRVLAGITDPQQAAERLVELVLAGAAADNVTAVVVDTVTARPDAGPDALRRTLLDRTVALDHDGGAPAIGARIDTPTDA